jgi:hypothetical protein
MAIGQPFKFHHDIQRFYYGAGFACFMRNIQTYAFALRNDSSYYCWMMQLNEQPDAPPHVF